MPDAIREYHERTKLFPGANPLRRVAAALIPKQYKRYVDLQTFDLPPTGRSGRTLFDTLRPNSDAPAALDLESLAAVLHYSAGIVRRRTVGGRELAFRAASCTGALYHIELYVVCGDLGPELPDGLYHYDVPSGSLRLMRGGDYRNALADACADDRIAAAAASVVLTSTFWRNAWRYEERAYRHVFWDAGTLLANLLTVAEAHGLAPELRSAFIDADVNALLGLDARREAAVAVVSLGASLPAAETAVEVEPLQLKTESLSRAEIEYPLIWQTHEASALPSAEEVRAWRDQVVASRPPPSPDVPPRSALSLEESIEQRGSSRRFADTPMPRDAFDAVLSAARGSLRSDHALAGSLCRPVLIVNRVEGIAPGAYGLDASGQPVLIKAGGFASEAAHLALDQPAAGSAAVNLYLVASFDAVAAMGERGYRAAQMEAGIRTGQVYLAAASLGLKASGLTFYDEVVAAFFGLDPIEDLVLMLVVFGP